jgi:hypothetical protein
MRTFWYFTLILTVVYAIYYTIIIAIDLHRKPKKADSGELILTDGILDDGEVASDGVVVTTEQPHEFYETPEGGFSDDARYAGYEPAGDLDKGYDCGLENDEEEDAFYEQISTPEGFDAYLNEEGAEVDTDNLASYVIDELEEMYGFEVVQEESKKLDTIIPQIEEEYTPEDFALLLIQPKPKSSRGVELINAMRPLML